MCGPADALCLCCWLAWCVQVTAYQVLWILSYTATTLYTWTWDVVMDWGLWAPGQTSIREERLYSQVGRTRKSTQCHLT